MVQSVKYYKIQKDENYNSVYLLFCIDKPFFFDRGKGPDPNSYSPGVRVWTGILSMIGSASVLPNSIENLSFDIWCTLRDKGS